MPKTVCVVTFARRKVVGDVERIDEVHQGVSLVTVGLHSVAQLCVTLGEGGLQALAGRSAGALAEEREEVGQGYQRELGQSSCGRSSAMAFS